MSLLTAHHLAMSFGPHDVFQNVECVISWGDRIGLVGPNGEGKTTLLRILAGELEPTAGEVHRRRGLTIGYLAQEPPPPGDKTLWEDMLEAFKDLIAEERKLAELETKMAHPDARIAQAALEAYARRQHEFELKGGYDYPVRIRQTLTGLGFKPELFHQPLAQLSGGQRTRARLAKILLRQPTLLLLDEPTNHLDLAAIEWLENTLMKWEGAMVVVSHDRYFLDKVMNRIWEMMWGALTTYRGNYSQYLIQRQATLERLQKEYEAQQALIAKETDFIRRNIAGQKSRQARGRRKRLERLLQRQRLVAPRQRQTMRLQMMSRIRSGELVLATEDLAVGYRAHPLPPIRRERSGGYVYEAPAAITPEDTLLFRADDVLFKRGERVGLVGPNGSGKTTFIRTLLGEVAPLEGRLRIGASIRIGYLAQAQDELQPNMTVLDALLEADPRLTVGEARAYLARFLFTGDDVFKTIATLSGGQRSRLALARLSRQEVNFLVLDEPTNHLDIESQEVLEAMLRDFNGSVLLVSHDRYLIDAIATQVWVIDPVAKHMFAYKGNYSAYLAEKEKDAFSAKAAEQDKKAKNQRQRERSKEARRKRKEAEKRKQEAEALEERIHAKEQELEAITQALERASKAQRVDEVQKLGERYQSLERELEELIETWASLV